MVFSPCVISFSSFRLLSVLNVNCMDAVWYELCGRCSCKSVSLYSECTCFTSPISICVLSCLEIEGSLPDNISPKVLLFCVKSNGSDRCVLNCPSKVHVISGKSNRTKQV